MNLDSSEKEIIATPDVLFRLTFERLIVPDFPLVMPFHYLDNYRKGVEQIQRLYKFHQRGGTDHGKLHTARVPLPCPCGQPGRKNQTESSKTIAALQRHCFP